MGHKPAVIGRIAGKAASDVVKDPSPVHAKKCVLCHSQAVFVTAQLVLLNQKQQHCRSRKFGRRAEPTVDVVKGCIKICQGLSRDIF